MGQRREVEVLRFIVNESVEVKMLQIQEKKKSVASDTLGFEQFSAGGEDDESKASSKLTLDDLKEFFS
jgi:SNF2 family DNA or RNA helicase